MLGKWKHNLGRVWQRAVDWVMGNGLMQEELMADECGSVATEMSAMVRRSAAESCVLLENDGTLPLQAEEPVAVFGRCQLDWFYVGYGSGGDVHPPYYVNFVEGLENAGISVDRIVAETYQHWCGSEEHRADHGWWGHWPMSHPEMPLEQRLIRDAAVRCQTAIVVIGRAAGEDRENTLTPGSYYLTDAEQAMLNAVTAEFLHTVVLLNVGGIMDLSWVESYGSRISALLLVWQGGMESGNAVADVLTGRVNPSGRLADTIANHYEDYPSSRSFGGELYNHYEEDIFVGYRYFETFAPERVQYPFGYGLSYTTFAYQSMGITQENGVFTVTAVVTNTGAMAGREVVLLWCSAPQGKLGKAEKVLAAFGKTGLLAPGESETMSLTFDKQSIASYDDVGKTVYPHAFVLEAGAYRFFLHEQEVGSVIVGETECVRQCESACCVKEQFTRMTAREVNGEHFQEWELLVPGSVDLRQRILDQLPAEIPVTGDLGYRLSDVATGRISLDAFVAQLSDAELEALTRGEGGMRSALGVAGNAGAFGGVLPSLREKGVPPVITADGPSGLRLRKYCALLPSGTALACTFDVALVESLYALVGEEMIERELDIVLGPGMNIHRNPLCGRNFEYYSEDPLLSGKIGAAAIRGVQRHGKSCCPKHFACNNQETRRNSNDSRVSERALREIYLRGFEIAVKEGKPNTLMTSYNLINGVWGHYHFDLVTTILRKDWGFDGVVLTDWWMRRSVSPEFPQIEDNAYRVRAGVDVLMPGDMSHVKKKYRSDGTLLKTLGKPGGITRGELQRTAKTVLRFILYAKGADLLR